MKKKASAPRTPYQRKRKEAKLSQEKAAERLDISSRTIQFIEAGMREPKISTAFAMADLYGCSIEEFRAQAKKEEDEDNEGPPV